MISSGHIESKFSATVYFTTVATCYGNWKRGELEQLGIFGDATLHIRGMWVRLQNGTVVAYYNNSRYGFIMGESTIILKRVPTLLK